MRASIFLRRLLSVLMALCLCLGLSCGAFASSGEASASSVPGVIEVDGGTASVTAETAEITVAGEVTDSSASGVLITDDDVGTSGLHITSGAYTLGGEEGYFGIEYDEDGVPYATEEGEYNSVIILNDAAHESDLLYSQGSSENSLGTGVYAEGEDSLLYVENSYIWTSGAVRSAIGVYQLGTVVVKDSYIESTGALVCYKPVTRLLLSTCRANVFVGGSAYYYNTTAVSGDWGALSTDTGGANSTYLYAYNVLTDNPNGGYSTYADTNCFVEIYGSEMYSAEYGGFIACSGVLRIGSSDEASEEALKYADEEDLLTESKDSLVSAGRNAIVVHLVDSMGNNSGYNTTTGVLNISNTTLQTDKDILTTRDYYNDENGDAYGECGYFLNYSAGSGIALRSTNIEMTLDNVTFDVYENAVTGRPIAIHSILNYDARGAVSVPDGEESLGQSIALSNMSVDGDIVHNDYQRPMTITTENVVINGAIVSGTCAAWNALWSDVEDNGLAENFDADMIYSMLTKNETYDTVWGVRLSLDADSVWNVSGDSSLYSLSVEEGAVIQAADGYEIEIYVDCAMSNSDTFYDCTTGTQVDSLPAGEYQGVVILTSEAADTAGASGESAAASGDSSEEAALAAKNISYQHNDYAAVAVNSGEVSLSPEYVDILAVADETLVTGEQVAGVYIFAENIGRVTVDETDEYAAYTVGVTGISVVDSSTVIGSDQGYYDVSYEIGGSEVPEVTDGSEYSNVIILDNQDETVWDEANMRRGENSYGVGVSTGGLDSYGETIQVENTFVWFDGWVRTALLSNYGTDSLGAEIVVSDSTFVGLGGESYKYGWMALYGGARSTILQTGGNHYFYSSEIITEGWGAYALEGVPSNLIMVNSLGVAYGGGYGVYNPGTLWSEMYGSRLESAMYGMFLTNDSKAVIAALDDVDEDGVSLYSDSVVYAYEEQEEVAASETVAEDGGSYINADFAALLIHNTAMSRNGTDGDEAYTYVHGSVLSTVDPTYSFSDDALSIYLLDYTASEDCVNGGASLFWIANWRGAAIVNRSSNWTLTIEDSELLSRTGEIYHSTPDWEGANKVENFMIDDSVTSAPGSVVTLKNMSASGDVIHDDFFRPMSLYLESAELEGAVVSGTMGSWNEKFSVESILASETWAWAQEQVAAWQAGEVPNSIQNELSAYGDFELSAERISANLTYDPSEVDKTFEGVSVTVDGSSKWIVTGTSSMASLLMAEGAEIVAPEGMSLTVYVDVSMDNADAAFDVSTGTELAELTPGTYENAVILVA